MVPCRRCGLRISGFALTGDMSLPPRWTLKADLKFLASSLAEANPEAFLGE
jgi:hypothetical protein